MTIGRDLRGDGMKTNAVRLLEEGSMYEQLDLLTVSDADR
jgi:hypothetical protein